MNAAGQGNRELGRLLTHLWWIKAPGSALFIWVFFEAYFFLLRHPATTAFEMPLTWIDRALPMQWWAWLPYLSLWVYITLPPALMPNVRQLLFYGLSVGLVCGAGLACFYYWPTIVPALTKPPEDSLALVQGIDAAGNACPSLHVAIAVFSAIWLHHQLCAIGISRFWRLGNWVWCLAIVYSTLATKQHVLIDMLAGIALGVAGGYLSLSAFRRRLMRGQL